MLSCAVFDVLPTNLHAVHRAVGHHWAEKPLIGAAPNFESMGAEPDNIRIVGRVLPQMFGPGSLDLLKQMARAPVPNMLIRGDGEVLGWHVIHLFREQHSYLDRTGLGRVIEFEMDLRSTPNGPGADALLSILQGLFP